MDPSKQAREIAKNAYSPYSKIQVGCAVVMDDGKTYLGTNVENASYGATICAERSAIFSAVSQGSRKISHIYIYTLQGFPPCGMCRQVIQEFCVEETMVTLINQNDEKVTKPFSEIFPDGFSPAHLNK